MYNRLCSPEMSFEKRAESEPHAFVSYAVDGEKESVPISFILNFPFSWREQKGFDRGYLYKVFWSPTENDSPSRMLKRVAQIPTFENCSLTKPGYYRAAVVEVGENLDDLLSKMEKKRVSVPLQLTSSFSKSSIKKEKKKKIQSPDPNQPIVKRKGGRKDKSEVKKRQVQLDNVSDFKDDIKLLYPHLFMDNQNATEVSREGVSLSSKESDLKDTCFGGGSKSGTGEGDSNNPDDGNMAMISGKKTGRSPSTQQGREKLGNSLKEGKDRGNDEKFQEKQASTDSSDASSFELAESFSGQRTEVKSTLTLGPRKSSRALQSRKRVVVEETSSETDLEPDTAKRVRIDPDFSPMKLVRVEEDNKIILSTNKRLHALNIKLQEKLFGLVNQISQYGTTVSNLETEKKYLKNKIQSLEGELKKMKCTVLNKNDSTKAERVGHQTEERDAPAKVQRALFVDSGSSSHNIASPSSRDLSFPNSPQSEWIDDPAPLCETVLKIVDDEVHTNASDVGSPTQAPDDIQDPLILCPGTKLKPELWKLISTIPPGERKDLQFLKDLALAAFGPEVLATSSIKGTARGGRVKNSEKIKKSALDPTILKAIIDRLAVRVAQSEGIPVNKLKRDTNPRLDQKRIYSAIRDMQKKLRKDGFGVGQKSNDVTAALLGPSAPTTV